MSHESFAIGVDGKLQRRRAAVVGHLTHDQQCRLELVGRVALAENADCQLLVKSAEHHGCPVHHNLEDSVTVSVCHYLSCLI